jgi:uncharacterized protein YukE
MMPVRPPLVAAANPDLSTDPWAGMWIAEDIETILAGIKSGSWIDTTLGAVSAGLDALAFVSDPIGSLLQYGAAWIIEHVKPLSEALDWLAGDPGQIAAHAQTWRNIAGELDGRASDLDRAVRWNTTEWQGTAADAYRTWTGQQRGAVTALAGAAETMSTITEGAGMLVAGVRMMVRDAIAVLVSRLITYAAEEVFSFGLATPLVVEQVSTLCASWAARRHHLPGQGQETRSRCDPVVQRGIGSQCRGEVRHRHLGPDHLPREQGHPRDLRPDFAGRFDRAFPDWLPQRGGPSQDAGPREVSPRRTGKRQALPENCGGVRCF